MRLPSRLALAAAIAFTATACSTPAAPPARPGPATPASSTAASPGTTPPHPTTTRARITADTARALHANELGHIPILMYHRLTPHPTSVYERTPADFTAELTRLANEHYIPTTTAALTTRHLDLPPGTHPVVLTFDDGDPSIFTLTPHGDPAPGTAIRILLDTAATHPGFTPTASLYVNQHPYGEPDGGPALAWLHHHGFEIGNHTKTHTNLRTVTPAAADTAISDGDTLIRHAIPGYQPTTLALPYGAHPHQENLTLHGSTYTYTGALLVGAGPAPSPYSTRFTPQSIPRIRSQTTGKESQYGSTHWLDLLAQPGSHLYTSDGDPTTITYPRSETTLAPDLTSQALAY
ncbi:polysaccharide deacetylase family protein [Amycolatopsis sp. PS_44_ISF1]|uniref:polysaccharide deacetylase family protein n=1 Tax=Amycolatopsis sp. PS_44_ISF1 TaxID=2974917 RepID=UPI0028DE9388|nr:polysaccharide deacetylase family protein [Amycolatopsis sp. PS_44_ISF1]MDT8912988.1 polysaccharide deacetylase family protein [Amycolatopsis sp. PS_44_ISF1]